MANLKSYQTKLTVGNLYKLTEVRPRPVGNAWLTLQGAGTVDIYVAEDGATPDTDPANLTDMGKTIEGTVTSVSIEGNHNFISIQQNTATNTVYISGIAAEDLGAIT